MVLAASCTRIHFIKLICGANGVVVGIAVSVRAVLVQAGGAECHVNKTNSILGLLMYASYFVLFLKLFLDSYVFAKKPPADKKKSK